MVIENDKQFADAKRVLPVLDLEIAERRALLKVRTLARRKLLREMQLWNARKAVAGKS